MASKKAAAAEPTVKVDEIPTVEEQLEMAEAADAAAAIAEPEPPLVTGVDVAKEGSDSTVVLVRYHVSGFQTCIAFGELVYPVKDHKVELPAGASWYAHLIENKTLVQDRE